MSNYTKEELEGKVKKDLIKIAQDLNLSSTGNRAVLIDRIFKHKPSFKEMVESAPVTKDEDLTISIEEKPNLPNDEVDVGVEVNDPYPDEEAKAEGATAEELSHAVPEAEDKEPKAETEVETETETEVETETPPADEKLIPSNMVSENTAEDILKGWQGTIQGFYRKNAPGIAPSRPASVATIAQELGIPAAVGVLSNWQASIVSRLRPVRGIAPAPPKTAKDMVQIIKSL